ncbi:MAG: hypothetical protein ABFE07_28750 [Armatimonadia bacterium]
MIGHKCVPMSIAEWEGINYYCWHCHAGFEEKMAQCACGSRDIRSVSGTLAEMRVREDLAREAQRESKERLERERAATPKLAVYAGEPVEVLGEDRFNERQVCVRRPDGKCQNVFRHELKARES